MSTELPEVFTVRGKNGRTYPIPFLRLIDLREIDEETGCWNFTGNLNPDGYGRFRVDGKLVLPHRFTYQMFCGPIPAGLVTDHLCKNKRCFNPFHLELVTNRENIRRGTQGWNLLGGGRALTGRKP